MNGLSALSGLSAIFNEGNPAPPANTPQLDFSVDTNSQYLIAPNPSPMRM